VHVIGDPANFERHASGIEDDPADVGMQFDAQLGSNQGTTVFRAEDNVIEKVCVGRWHL
jgi:hypothetical protein